METQIAQLALELDGPAVGLDTVDGRAALRLASAYIDLLARVVEEQLGDNLHFESLHVESGSVEVLTQARPAHLAREGDSLIIAFEGGREIPRGVKSAWGAYRDAVRGLPAGYVAKRLLDREERHLLAPDVALQERPWGSVALRARLLRVGGKRASARFESDSEEAAFTLHLTEDQAKSISHHLYDEIDIYASVQRDNRGQIVAGDLDRFASIPDIDAAEAWRHWYHENGCHWDRSGRGRGGDGDAS